MECYPKLRERGQVTIPEEVRTVLGVAAGDRLKLTVEPATGTETDTDGQREAN